MKNKLKIILIFVIFTQLFFIIPSANATLNFVSVNGQQPIAYITYTIINNQSQTGSGMPQLIIVNSAQTSDYLSKFLENVNWQTGNGDILYSYLESNATRNNTQTVYWVKLPSQISTNGTLDVYYCIYPQSVNALNNNNTGAYPTYTENYGIYDNGGNVFSNYWNFNGTTLATGFTAKRSAGYYVQNNGIMVYSNTNDWESLATISTFNPQNLAIDAYAYFNGLHGTNAAYRVLGWNPPYANLPQHVISDYNSTAKYSLATYNSAQGSIIFNSGITTNYQMFTLWITTTKIYGMINYTDSQNTSTNFVTTTSAPLGFAVLLGGSTIYVQYMRLRIIPPNGIMPTVNTGTLTSLISNYATVNDVMTNTVFYSNMSILQNGNYTIPTPEPTATPFQFLGNATVNDVKKNQSFYSNSSILLYGNYTQPTAQPTATPFDLTNYSTNEETQNNLVFLTVVFIAVVIVIILFIIKMEKRR